MNNALFSILACIAFSTHSIGQNTYELNGLKIDYHVHNEMFNGEYKSFYQNGKIKASGFYKNNSRVGIWQIWDSTGVLKIKRNYTSPFTYERIMPQIPKKGPIPLLSEFPFELKRDSNNLHEYYPLQEQEVVWLRRLTTKIPNHNQSIFDTIIHLVKDSTMAVYDTVDLDFATTYNLNQLDSSKMFIDHYLTISETFFDHTRYVMETRIIGLCPLIKTQNGTQKLFWIYYPCLRPYLNSFKVDSSFNSRIQNFDDLLYFHELPYILLSKRSVYNYNKTEFPENNQLFPNKLNFEEIEVEHDLWIRFHSGF